MKNLFNIVFAALTLSAATLPAQQDIAITVTNSNLALVRESRSFELKKGQQTILLEEIPALIQPASVLIESSGNSFTVLEQNFEYDLITVSKILQKSLDKNIMLIHPDLGPISGKLLSASGGQLILLDDRDNLQIVPHSNDLKVVLEDFSQSGAGFITRPSLVWKIESSKAGQQTAGISYLTNGLNWQADYVAKLNDTDSAIKLASWVTLNNSSGRDYNNAHLKLMAGDLNVVRERLRKRRDEVMEMTVQAKPSFQEKSFFEYHLYTLQRRTDIGNNQSKQVQLFPETEAAVKKLYRVDSNKGQDVQVLVSFKNSRENNLGLALPAGRIRVYKSDGKDLEFIGEDQIKHTPRDEDIEIKVGKAFDIVSEREVLDSQRPSRRSRQLTVEYSIRNHKENDIRVEVLERLNAYQQSKLIESNIKPAEKRAAYFKFEVPVAAEKEARLKFTYSISW